LSLLLTPPIPTLAFPGPDAVSWAPSNRGLLQEIHGMTLFDASVSAAQAGIVGRDW